MNEEQNVFDVVTSIPRVIPGVDQIDVLVIDDGSEDDTIARAIEAGVDVVISSKVTRGLAKSFSIGIEYALAQRYDILVNTDGDNQYHQEKIPELIKPIVAGQADIVVGNRETQSLMHFGAVKRLLQKLGSRVLATVSGVRIDDAASGFRSYSRFALSKLFVATRFSYAMEVIVQSGHKGLRLANVSTGAKFVERPSRLFKSSWRHVMSSTHAIFMSYLLHKPSLVFGRISLLLAIFGLVPFVRYFILTFFDSAGDHLQSLIVGSILLTSALFAASLGVLAHLSKFSRELIESHLSYQRIAGRSLSNLLDSEGYEIVYTSKHIAS